MRKVYIFSWMLLLIFVLLNAGCEDEDSTSLEGTWQAFKLVYYDMSGDESEHDLPEDWEEVLSLNPDGTFLSDSTQKGRTYTAKGSWSRTSDDLLFVQRGEGQMVYEIDGNTLVLSGNIPEGSFSLFWKKIN